MFQWIVHDRSRKIEPTFPTLKATFKQTNRTSFKIEHLWKRRWCMNMWYKIWSSICYSDYWFAPSFKGCLHVGVANKNSSSTQVCERHQRLELASYWAFEKRLFFCSDSRRLHSSTEHLASCSSVQALFPGQATGSISRMCVSNKLSLFEKHPSAVSNLPQGWAPRGEGRCPVTGSPQQSSLCPLLNSKLFAGRAGLPAGVPGTL